jgi:hypothetical protein
MKQALILGCSHALGSEMWKSPDANISEEESWAVKDGYGLERCYPALIAKELGYEPNNRAIAGGSNDAMFRILEESRLRPPDIVIACWSGGNRTEIYNEEDQEWVPLSVGNKVDDTYTEYLKQWVSWVNTSEQSRINKMKNIYALNALAKTKRLKVINIDSFWPIYNVKWGADMYWPVTDTFHNWSMDRNFARTDWGHYFEDAHRAFAEHVVQAIGDTPFD